MYTYYTTPNDDSDDDYYLDYTAAVLQLLCVVICVVGLRLGKQVINIFTVAKLILVAFMIVAALACWDEPIFESAETFAPDGMSGVITGSSLLFFGFIGFDEVCCLAAKSSDPTRTMPRAIAGTLGGAALLSMVAQLALSGMTPVTSKCPDLACTSANQCQQTFSETTPGCRSFRKYGLSLLRGIIRGPRLACSKRRHCSW